MKLPLFYKEDITSDDTFAVLDEAGSKHIIQVLRMQAGEQLQLTDGRGNIYTVAITDDNRKKCTVKILNSQHQPFAGHKIFIAISPLKNAGRFEWFLEKATEIGITGIIPLICARTEKQQVKTARLKGILVSAMLQSQQAWMPRLFEPAPFGGLWKGTDAWPPMGEMETFIAHCEDGDHKKQLSHYASHGQKPRIILIGPEGDFTNKEITTAITNGAIPVALGETRLRTETAGIVAAALLRHL
jgi:16S rRNA (uracil1498-N3)-methyltransferase